MIDREARDKLGDLLQRLLENPEEEPADFDAKRWPSDDAAIKGILVRLDTLRPLLQTDDPGTLMKWSRNMEFGSNKDGSEEAFSRRKIKQAVEFLRTDREYCWKGDIDLSWWMLLPLTIVILGIMHLSETLGLGIMLLVISYSTIFSLFIKVSDRITGRDRHYWPFKNRDDYEAATNGSIYSSPL